MPSHASSYVRLLAFALIAATTANAQGADTDTRRAWPSPEELQTSRAIVRKDFADWFEKSISAESKHELGAILIGKAATMQPSAHHCALIDEARLLLLAAGDVRPALDGAATLASTYRIDELQLKAETLAALDGTKRACQQRVEIAMQRLALLRRATAAGRTKLALELARAVTLARQNNGPMPPEYDDLERSELAMAFRRVARNRKIEPARKALLDNPKDAAANDKYGAHLCLTMGRWSAGIDHLAKSDDTALASAAQLDQRGADDDPGRIRIAESWWRIAESRSEDAESARRRAADWLTQNSNPHTEAIAARIAQVREGLRKEVRALGLAIDEPVATHLQTAVVAIHAEKYPALVTTVDARKLLKACRPVHPKAPGEPWGEVIIGDVTLTEEKRREVAAKMTALLNEKVPAALAMGDVMIVNFLGMWVADIPAHARTTSKMPIRRASGPVILAVEPDFGNTTIARQTPPVGSVLWMAGSTKIKTLREFVSQAIATADKARGPRPMVRIVYTYPVKRATMTDHIQFTKPQIETVRKTLRSLEW